MKVISLRQKLVVAVVAIIMAFAFAGLKADAQVVQTQEGDKSVTISWDNSTDVDYSIGWAKLSGDWKQKDAQEDAAEAMADARKVVLGANQRSYTITGLENNAEYYVVLNYAWKIGDTVHYSHIYLRAYTKATGVFNVAQVKWYKYIESVEVSWDEVPGKNVSYELVFMNSKGKTIERKTLSYNHYSHAIKNNNIYTVKVRATRTTDCGASTTPWSTTQYLFTQPTVKSAKISKGKLTISWNKISGATSYTVYVADKNKKSAFKKVGSVSSKKSKLTINKTKGKKGKKFSSKKTYYVYVCANKKVKGKVITKDVTYIYKIKGSGTPSEDYKSNMK